MIKPVKKHLKKENNILVYCVLIFFAVIALLPLYYLVITCFKDLNEASTKATMWPQSFALWDNIRFVFSYPDYSYLRMFLNTILIIVLKTVGTCITCSLAGYGFAIYKFPGKKIIFFIMLSAMMIPGEILNIPIYEFMVNSGLKEVVYLPLWIACYFGTDIFIIFLFKQFFSAMPKALIEAARIDGYSEFKIFTKIVVPLNKPVFITVIILYFVGTYNDLYSPALYITEQKNWLMAQSINIFETLYQSGSSSYIVPWNYVAVACVAAILPVIILFSLLQKQFIESFTNVGIKE